VTIRRWAGYALGAACLAWTAHLVSGRDFIHHVRGLNWRLVALAVSVDVLSYACQGVRWKLLLQPVGRLSWFDATQAIYAGLFTSEVLPLRAGEGVRAWIAARRLGTGVTAVVPSMLAERLFDGLWLMTGIGLVATAVSLPQPLSGIGRAFAGTLLAATCTILYVASRPAPPPRPGVVSSVLARIRTGLAAIGLAPRTWLAFAFSFLLISGQVLAFWIVLRAYGIPLPLWSGAAVAFMVQLGTAIPNAPANVGTYQFFTILGLSVFHVTASIAAGFSMVVFVILTVPLWLLGGLAVIRVNAALGTIRPHDGAGGADGRA
jgi:glycosyltransferase 2 family protein